jgi:hypothetical protein
VKAPGSNHDFCLDGFGDLLKTIGTAQTKQSSQGRLKLDLPPYARRSRRFRHYALLPDRGWRVAVFGRRVRSSLVVQCIVRRIQQFVSRWKRVEEEEEVQEVGPEQEEGLGQEEGSAQEGLEHENQTRRSQTALAKWRSKVQTSWASSAQ